MYAAVKKGQVDIITAFSTDSRIPGYNLFILEDDKSFFPPYYAAPIVRKEVIEKYPEVQKALSLLSNLIDEKTMQELNYEVDQNKHGVKEIVRDFFKEKALL
jgi:glycine betaine/choline ABC-type transport system substrate-binding protein